MVDYSQFERYFISKTGEIYNSNNLRMKTITDKNGYEVVGLVGNNHKKYLVKVHRLVATRYIPTNDYSLTVNHIDGNKQNNSVENLEWLSSADNLRHSWRELNRKHYTRAVVNSKGEVFPSAKEAAQKYGVRLSAISNCALGRTKTSCGMKWRYEDVK